jgi:hypothetical protein
MLGGLSLRDTISNGSKGDQKSMVNATVSQNVTMSKPDTTGKVTQ